MRHGDWRDAYAVTINVPTAAEPPSIHVNGKQVDLGHRWAPAGDHGYAVTTSFAGTSAYPVINVNGVFIDPRVAADNAAVINDARAAMDDLIRLVDSGRVDGIRSVSDSLHSIRNRLAGLDEPPF